LKTYRWSFDSITTHIFNLESVSNQGAFFTVRAN